ncbi:MAG: alpha/beta fold hydrolase [Deltaproteobacteria bacterium]|nr:alpha/beta fold hydrolase [Deltaproteobacteria bacterium]
MKTLVLLHGWGASGAIWQRQTLAFGGECRVLTPGIPRWEAGWLHEYLAAVPLRESVLVGWSLGGMLLLEALARLEGPAPLATVLVGVAPVFCRQPDHPWGQPVAALRAMRRTLRSEPRRVINDFARACLAPGEESYRPEVAAGFDFSATAVHLASGLDYLRDKDLRGLLPGIPGRIIIMQGEQDKIVPPAQARFLQEHLPGSSLYMLAGAGHMPFLTQAAAFNDILRRLL